MHACMHEQSFRNLQVPHKDAPHGDAEAAVPCATRSIPTCMHACIHVHDMFIHA